MSILCEPYAGVAAISLNSHGIQAYPPRTGNKNKVAQATLGRIHAGVPHSFIWADQDPHIRQLLRSYTDEDIHSQAYDYLMSRNEWDPRTLWDLCREEVLDQRKGKSALCLGPWIVASAWSITKGCNSLSYAGPGKVTKAGRVPAFIGSTSRMAARLPRLPPHVKSEVFEDAAQAVTRANELSDVVVYVDPPYLGMGRTHYVKSGGHSMTEGLLVAAQSIHPTWVASGHQISPTSQVIGNTTFRRTPKADWLTRIDRGVP